MKISFLDAHLQWIPEYFVASVALRVKLLAHEFLIDGAWGSDDQVVRFQRSIQLSNEKNEEGKIPILVELIATLNESGSESRIIGSGVCMIFSRDERERTKMITLNSGNMEVVMARLLISISAGSSLGSNSGNIESGDSIMILPATENNDSPVRAAGPGATHLVGETEKNISMSMSRISCLTLNSCYQKQNDLKIREKYSTVSNDTDAQTFATGTKIIRENIPDVSIPALGICSTEQRVDEPSTLSAKARSKSAPIHIRASPRTSSVQTDHFYLRGSGRLKVSNSNSADKTVQIGLGTYSRNQVDTSSSTLDMTVDCILQNSAKIRNEGVRMSTDFAGGIEFPSKKTVTDDAVLRKSFSGFENASRTQKRNSSLSREPHKEIKSPKSRVDTLDRGRERERESSCLADTPIDASSSSRIRYIPVGKENEMQRKSLEQHFSLPRNHADFSSLLKANDACERVRDVLQKKNILLEKAKAKANALSAQRPNEISTAAARGKSPAPSAALSTASPPRDRGSRSNPRVPTEEAPTLLPRGRSIDPPSRNLARFAGTLRTPIRVSNLNRDRGTQKPGGIEASVSMQSGDTDIEDLVSTLLSSSRRRPLRDTDSRQDPASSDIDLVLDMQNRLKAAEKRREIILKNAKDKARDAATKAASKSLAIKEAVLQSTKAFDKLRNSFDKQNETLEKVKSELFAKKRNERARSTDGNPMAGSGGRRSSSFSYSALDGRRRATSTSGPRATSAPSLPFSNLRMRSMSAGREVRSDQLDQCDKRYEAEEKPLPLPGTRSRSADLTPLSRESRELPSSSTADHQSQRSSGPLLAQGNARRSTSSRAVTRKSTHVDVVSALESDVRDAEAVDSNVDRDVKAPLTASSPTPQGPGLSPKGTVPDVTSYRSQNLLVTLVLDRIEAIQGLMEGAPKDEAQSMFEMIERLASLVLALTAVIKTDTVAVRSSVVTNSTPSHVDHVPLPPFAAQTGHENTESSSILSTDPLHTAPTSSSSSSGLGAVTARSGPGSVPSSVPQSRLRPYPHPVTPQRGENEDSSCESTDSDNVDMLFESPFKSIRMSSTSVSSEDSLTDSAVCIDIQGKRDQAENRLSDRMRSNRYQRQGALGCDPVPGGRGSGTLLERSLSDSPPFASSISELGIRTGTGTESGLHRGRIYSQAYASKAKAVPSSPTPFSSYLLQDQPLNPSPQPKPESESAEGLTLPATDWLFDDGEASSGVMSHDLAHVSRAIGNLQVHHCITTQSDLALTCLSTPM
jgi:hypothetical protein